MSVDLLQAFQAHPEGAALLPASGPLVVAVSGGLDSVVLLHLLRFGALADPERLVAAHIDHGMRAESAADAEWVRQLCGTWQVSCVVRRLDAAPASEAEAREGRWQALAEVSAQAGAMAIITAHHLDDQAETVLHHVARGTGLRGLRGMLPRSESEPELQPELQTGPQTGARRQPHQRVRPLLPWTRAELHDYAQQHGLSWRDDATNLDRAFTRNRLRLDVLPALETAVPGATRSLARLAGLARDEEDALSEATQRLLEPMLRRPLEPGATHLRLPQAELAALGPALRTRLLRAAARRLGVRLDASASNRAAEFVAQAQSGQELHLTDALVVSRGFDDIQMAAGAATTVAAPPASPPPATGAPAAEVCLEPIEQGSVALDLAPALDTAAPGTASPEPPERITWRISWRAAASQSGSPAGQAPSASPPAPDDWRIELAVSALHLPLSVRAWRPGDRVRRAGGTSKVTKLFMAARLDRARRRGHPVVCDARGHVIWVPGVPGAVAEGVQMHDAGTDGPPPTFLQLEIRHDPE